MIKKVKQTFNVNAPLSQVQIFWWLISCLYRFGQSSALANANAYNQYQGPGGFGANAANAGAQSFQSQGPLGGFGASAANSGSQGFNAGPGGITGSAGMSGSQTYNLPGGRNINLAYGQGFSHANGVGSGSNTNSLTYT